MSKWKCEICDLEFENFHAQGFNHKIYCPLCYFKELYRQAELEINRLNNIINELEKDIKNLYTYGIKNNAEQRDYLLNRLDGLKELKGGEK